MSEADALREHEQASLAVLDAANVWESSNDAHSRATAARDLIAAVRAWRDASGKLVAVHRRPSHVELHGFDERGMPVNVDHTGRFETPAQRDARVGIITRAMADDVDGKNRGGQ